MNVLGIDPGLSGALAVFQNGELRALYDMPLVGYKISGGKTRNEINVPNLENKVTLCTFDMCYLEGVNGMPGRGATEFRFGESYGMIKATLACNRVPYELVSPQRWKAHFGLTKDKDAARALAAEKFPDKAHYFKRKKDDGRAEAALIGLYGLEISGFDFNLNS